MLLQRARGLLAAFVCLSFGPACGLLQVGVESPPTPADPGQQAAQATADASLRTQIVATATALRLTAQALEAPTGTEPPPEATSRPVHVSEQGVGISITAAARPLGGVDYLVYGPSVVSVAALDAQQVEFFLTPTGTDMAPQLQHVDADGSDGWQWVWSAPASGITAHLWAEAVYADGSRGVSPVLLVVTPDVLGTSAPASPSPPAATLAPPPTAPRPTTIVLPSPTAPPPTAPVPPPTETPAVSPRIFNFSATLRTNQGLDEVDLAWEAVGGDRAVVCPLVGSDEVTGRCIFQLPPSGARRLTSAEIAANYTGFRLIVQNAVGQAQAETALNVRCPGYETWFFNNPPVMCPAGPPLDSSAAVQRFERGRMFWIGARDLFLVLFDGQPSRMTPLQGPLQLRPGASPDNRSGETPPPGLQEPVSGFGLLWRGEVLGIDSLKDSLGWATEPESGFQTLYQCEIDREPYLNCYLRSPEGQTLNVFYLRYFGYFWEVR